MRTSNTNSLLVDASIEKLFRSPSKSKKLLSLNQAGLNCIYDLLWILPIRIRPTPKLASFQHMTDGELFIGRGQIISQSFRPAFKARGKGGMTLFQGTVHIRDSFTNNIALLKWFNCYPSVMKKIKNMEQLSFMGQVSLFGGQYQIVNPKILNEDSQSNHERDFIIEYPTINQVSGNYIRTLIEKIPQTFWSSIPETLPIDILQQRKLISLNQAFAVIHGQISTSDWDHHLLDKAKHRLKYEEFYQDQLKIRVRKKINAQRIGIKMASDSTKQKAFINSLPYTLTADQKRTIGEIQEDMTSDYAMMRMVQGDVGCGKTTLCLYAASIAIDNNYQVAFMCPTEALAQQHYNTLQSINLNHFEATRLLTGSTPHTERKQILKELKNGSIKLLVGTHALFQKDVNFKNLGLCLIDEQHKFGVKQRLRLLGKGSSPHCLIMTATPIPRTLQLTQYGDLSLSIIKTMPEGRKGVKTRIVREHHYQKFLSFIKTRIDLGEQIYIVVPAIEQNQSLDLKNINSVYEEYKKVFHDYSIATLHGQLSANEKVNILEGFTKGVIDILISTSVIEVGINNPNACVMAIYDAQRFGLSSLHQLRGRVGRGSKTGFCFLIPGHNTSQEGVERLRVIEKSHDGFYIAEEDLKFRGHGDLFGSEQSGVIYQKKIANIIHDYSVLETTIKDVKTIEMTHPQYFQSIEHKLGEDLSVTSTV